MVDVEIKRRVRRGLARPVAATKVRRTSLSVAEFDSTDKDVRRTEEIAHEATKANGGHGSNTIETPISVPNCPQITQIHADEMLDVLDSRKERKKRKKEDRQRWSKIEFSNVAPRLCS